MSERPAGRRPPELVCRRSVFALLVLVRRAFARQCVLSLQEGARATLTLQAEGGASTPRAKYIGVQLVLSTDGLRLLWTPEPGAGASDAGQGATPTSGHVRTTDIRSVVYDAANLAVPIPSDEEARPLATRFAIQTPFETLNFASAPHGRSPLEQRSFPRPAGRPPTLAHAELAYW